MLIKFCYKMKSCFFAPPFLDGADAVVVVVDVRILDVLNNEICVAHFVFFIFFFLLDNVTKLIFLSASFLIVSDIQKKKKCSLCIWSPQEIKPEI